MTSPPFCLAYIRWELLPLHCSTNFPLPLCNRESLRAKE